MCTVMDSFLKHVFVRAGKHTTVHGVHPHLNCLYTGGNNKIHLHHTLAALKRYIPASLVTPLPNSEQINHPCSNHTYTKSTPNHMPPLQHTYTTHIISSTAPTYAPHCHPWILDRPRQSDCTAGQMDREPGWWTTSGKIRLFPLARVMGVGRQQQQQQPELLKLFEPQEYFVMIFHGFYKGRILLSRPTVFPTTT